MYGLGRNEPAKWAHLFGVHPFLNGESTRERGLAPSPMARNLSESPSESALYLCLAYIWSYIAGPAAQRATQFINKWDQYPGRPSSVPAALLLLQLEQSWGVT